MYSLTVSLYKLKLDSTTPKTGKEQSTRDATAVKILTIIALIYLPTTIVAVSIWILLQSQIISARFQNFFSTQFVHTDTDGNIQVSSSAWLLAALAIPLTAITVAIWWTWVRFFTEVKTPLTQQITITRIKRTDSFWSVFSKRKRQGSDLEAGRGLTPSSPQHVHFRPFPVP